MKVSVLSSPGRSLVFVLAAFLSFVPDASIGLVFAYTREDFPSDFIFGSATSANQVLYFVLFKLTFDYNIIF